MLHKHSGMVNIIFHCRLLIITKPHPLGGSSMFMRRTGFGLTILCSEFCVITLLQSVCITRYFAHTTLDDVMVTRRWCDRLCQLREVRLAWGERVKAPLLSLFQQFQGEPASKLAFFKGEWQTTTILRLHRAMYNSYKNS
jgi:hypothetical protein